MSTSVVLFSGPFKYEYYPNFYKEGFSNARTLPRGDFSNMLHYIQFKEAFAAYGRDSHSSHIIGNAIDDKAFLESNK